MISSQNKLDLEMGKNPSRSPGEQRTINFVNSKVHNDSTLHLDNNFVIPQFSKEWNEEYLVATFQPRAFRAVASLGSIFLACTISMVLGQGQDGFGGSRSLFYWTWSPYIICCGIYFGLTLLFSVDFCRPFCVSHYNTICSLSIILLYLSCVSTYVILELRAAGYGSIDYPQIRRTINFTAGFPPARECVDSDPARSWATVPPVLAFTANTCGSFVLSGASFSIYVLLNVLPMVRASRCSRSTVAWPRRPPPHCCALLGAPRRAGDSTPCPLPSLAAKPVPPPTRLSPRGPKRTSEIRAGPLGRRRDASLIT